MLQGRARARVRASKDIDEIVIGYTRELSPFLRHFQSQRARILSLVVKETASGAPCLRVV